MFRFPVVYSIMPSSEVALSFCFPFIMPRSEVVLFSFCFPFIPRGELSAEDNGSRKVWADCFFLLLAYVFYLPYPY